MNDDFAPSFRLPACPACSSLAHAERPIWRLARNLSIASGRKHWAFSGCNHAAEVSKPGKLYTEAAEIELVEEAWKHAAQAMFEAKIAGWTPANVDRFRRQLNDENVLPGTTGSFKF